MRLFINETDGCGKAPHENIIAVSNGHFRVAGELMAASIVQGGPAPDFMAPWVYDYISAGIEGVTVDKEKVVAQQSKELINRVGYYKYLQSTSAVHCEKYPKCITKQQQSIWELESILCIFTYTMSVLYRVYKKKLNRFEIALNFAKQLLVSSF